VNLPVGKALHRRAKSVGGGALVGGLADFVSYLYEYMHRGKSVYDK